MGILIVDDDTSIRAALSEILEDEGYTVSNASNGQEALRYLRQQPQAPCLILLDLMMPIMNGWDFRQVQQQDPQLSTIPVVVISADNNVSQKARTVGANGYLQKPINIPRLLNVVREYCYS